MSAIARQTSGTPEQEPRPLRVVIADDHPLMLAGIRRALERNDEIEIVGEACSGHEVLDLVERRRPELVLLDLRMPGMTGVECIGQIRTARPEVKVVVLSASDDASSINAALEAGASAYVVKSVMSADIATALRQVANGSVFHVRGPRPLDRPRSAEPSSEPALTQREQTILAAIATGMTTAAISKRLWVSEHTVKFHLTNVYRKLGVANRAAAVREAIAHGLLEI